MKSLFACFLLLAACWPAIGCAQTSLAPRLLVRLADPLQAELAAMGRRGPASQAFDHLNQLHGAVRVQALNPGRAPSFALSKRAVPPPAMYLILLPAGTDARKAQLDYQQSGLFRYVEVDAVGQGGGVRGTASNDTYYSRQWSLHNNGTFGLTKARTGADIHMPEAWAVTQGDTSVTVAIIDSGCKLDHPEFSHRIWHNWREIPGNGLDDDHNGYVDDRNGWNFVSETNDPTDDFGHGTNVAGIIGATGNNGLGYAGVNWGCKLLICKALDSQNLGYYSWWTSSLYYAVNNGARVINMSLGGKTTSQAMQDAVDYATEHGVVVVVCMMNDNSSVRNYPAALAGVIAVGATNPDDTRSSPFFWDAASGSNYGAHISVVAPGNYIYGLHHLTSSNYNTYWGGTSQATPHVAGLASLLLTLQPQLTPAQVKTILQTTADDQVGSPTEDKPGWDPYFGYGRVNAARALARVATATQGPTAAFALEIYPNPAHGALTLHLTDTRLLGYQVQLFNSVGQLVYQQRLASPTSRLPLSVVPGTYWLVVAGQKGNARQVLVE